MINCVLDRYDSSPRYSGSQQQGAGQMRGPPPQYSSYANANNHRGGYVNGAGAVEGGQVPPPHAFMPAPPQAPPQGPPMAPPPQQYDANNGAAAAYYGQRMAPIPPPQPQNNCNFFHYLVGISSNRHRNKQ